jgi:hypothetical protein
MLHRSHRPTSGTTLGIAGARAGTDRLGSFISLGRVTRSPLKVYTDLAHIHQHRRDHNRLGLAIQKAYWRNPSRMFPLTWPEKPTAWRQSA